MSPRWVMLVLLVGLPLALVGCGGSGRSSRATAPRPQGTLANDPELLRGRRVYIDYCSACHGIAGGGNVGPEFTDGKLLRDFDDAAAQEEFVRTGRAVMPAFGSQLSDDQIRAVVRYEREVLSVSRTP